MSPTEKFKPVVPNENLEGQLRELRLVLEALGKMEAPGRDEQRARVVSMMEALVKVFSMVVVEAP